MVRLIVLTLLAIVLGLVWGIVTDDNIKTVNVNRSKVQKSYDQIKYFSSYSHWKVKKCNGIRFEGNEKIKEKKLQKIVDKLNKQIEKYNENIDPNTGKTKLKDIEFEKIKLEYNNVAEEIDKLNSKPISPDQRIILEGFCDHMLDNLLLMEAKGGFIKTGFDKFIHDNNFSLLSKSQKVKLCYIIYKFDKEISKFRLYKFCGDQE